MGVLSVVIPSKVTAELDFDMDGGSKAKSGGVELSDMSLGFKGEDQCLWQYEVKVSSGEVQGGVDMVKMFVGQVKM